MTVSIDIRRRLASVGLFALGCMLGYSVRAKSVAQPTSHSEPTAITSVSIEVDAKDCPNPALRRSLELTAHDVYAILRDRFGGDPPQILPIRIRHGVHPFTAFPLDKVFHIELAHSLNSADYDRFVYELGHEMGHLWLGISAPTSNGTEETLASYCALLALDDMNDRWAVHPPYSDFQMYHCRFDEYRAQIENESSQQLPLDVQRAVSRRNWYTVSLYLRYHNRDLDADVDSPISRDYQDLGAMILRQHSFSLAAVRGFESLHNSEGGADAEKQDAAIQNVLHALGRQLPTSLIVAEIPPGANPIGGAIIQENGRRIWLYDCLPTDAAPIVARLKASNTIKCEIRTD